MYRFFLAVLTAVALIACNGNESDNPPDNPDKPVLPPPTPITITVVGQYPHDPAAFTQGLFFHNGKLYESTGLNEQSSIRIVDIKTGTPEKKYVIPDTTIFGEGIALYNNKIYQLTWVNHKILVYNLSDITKPVQSLLWKLEGWGITKDKRRYDLIGGEVKVESIF